MRKPAWSSNGALVIVKKYFSDTPLKLLLKKTNMGKMWNHACI